MVQKITEDNKYFYLYADCKPVKGYKNSAIYDLMQGEIHFFPSSYFELLISFRKFSIQQVKESLQKQDSENLNKFLKFLTDNDLGIFVEDIGLFPEIDTSWDHPSPLTNAIIDIGEKDYDINMVLKQLNDLRVANIQIRFYKLTSFKDLQKKLSGVRMTDIKSVEIISPWHPSLTPNNVDKLIDSNYRVTDVYLYNAPDNKVHVLKVAKLISRGRIIYSKAKINSCESCGLINKKSFCTPNMSNFNELMNYNGCLNRKISVDIHGNIKNCPSMKTSYGHVSTTPLVDVIKKSNFKKYWSIKKDDIEVCKDCEFRYVCTDCRVHIQDENNLFSKPAKCKYDPYTAEWKM
jgi:SPASM domain peptide maturase of grasp-with-spasm system